MLSSSMFAPTNSNCRALALSPDAHRAERVAPFIAFPPSTTTLFSIDCKRVRNSFKKRAFNSLSFHIHPHSFPASPLFTALKQNIPGVYILSFISTAAPATSASPLCAPRAGRGTMILSSRLHWKQSRDSGTASVVYGRFSSAACGCSAKKSLQGCDESRNSN
jgi:hypothetical protein